MSDAEFAEYPITLSHPAFVKSESIMVPGSERRDRLGNVVAADYRGTPEKFPPVTATTEREEEYYLAQGYQRAGKMDPAAWVRAHSDSPPVDYKPQAFPKWIDGKLYNSASEVPGYDPSLAADEPAPVEVKAPILTAASPSQEANLAAQMAELQAQMRAMLEQSQALSAENAELKAKAEANAAPNDEPRRRGRPPKARAE
jgi:hypothetical protein